MKKDIGTKTPLHIHNIAALQLSKHDIYTVVKLYPAFFSEFESTFIHFWNKDKKAIDYFSSQLDRWDQDTINECIAKLEQTIQSIQRILSHRIQLNTWPDIIFFLGEEYWDSHGILLENKSAVFFDLSAIIPRMHLPKFSFYQFVCHELIHGLHYQLNPSFYSGNYTTVEDHYMKRMIAEGLATYLSATLLDQPLTTAYWIGYLSEEEVQGWSQYCKQETYKIKERLWQTIAENVIDSSLTHDLFGIPDFANLNHSRMAYYYGTQIVKQIETETASSSLFSLLSRPYTSYRQTIDHYFEQNNT